ncbi:aminopeptidase N-like [Ruditapes philippinarum]|uniref:aminopeptidase N-like n=1 Tax=Ruditapes philippinarum TaxID=129788 RepID=UPI00295AD30E|nr:aminopeptidase N-like [Ruditapes philippinarum]
MQCSNLISENIDSCYTVALYKWNIPFAYTTSKEKNFNVKSKDITILPLGKKKVTITDDSIPKPKGNLKWVIANPQQFGLYRVKYDKRNWNALTDQLVSDHQVIHAINRAQIIDDAFSLYATEYQSLAIALRTLEYVNNEEEWLPWVTAQKWIDYIGKNIESTSEFDKYKAFVSDKVENIYTTLIVDSNNYTHIQLLLKDIIYDIGCSYGSPLCVNATIQEIAAWSLDPENLSDEAIDEEAYCLALSDENSNYWDFVFEQFKSNNDSTIRGRRIDALACSTNVDNLERLVEFAKTSVPEAIKIAYALGRHPAGRELEQIEVGFYIYLIINEFSTDEELTKFERFLEDVKDDIGDKPDINYYLQLALLDMKIWNDWLETNLPSVQSWLTGLGY